MALRLLGLGRGLRGLCGLGTRWIHQWPGKNGWSDEMDGLCVLILGLTLVFWNFDFFSDFHPTWPISSARSFASKQWSIMMISATETPSLSFTDQKSDHNIPQKHYDSHMVCIWYIMILWTFLFPGWVEMMFHCPLQRGLLRFQGAPCARSSSSQRPWRICCTERVKRGAMESAAFGGSWRKSHKNREGLALGGRTVRRRFGWISAWNSTWRTP